MNQALIALDKSPELPPVVADNIIARDYQEGGINETFKKFREGSPGVIARQATGTGKTILGCLVAQRWLEMDPDNRVIVLCHETQLVWQFAQEISDVLKVTPGIEMADRQVYLADMPVISVVSRASVGMRKRTNDEDGVVEDTSRLFKFDPMRFNWLIIIDECHRYHHQMKSVKHIVSHFDRNPKSKRLGLTATPRRTDGISLRGLFPDVVIDYPLHSLSGKPNAVEEGWAVGYNQKFVRVESVDFRNIREVAGDFDEAELQQVLNTQEVLAKLVDPLLDMVGDRRTLIFNPGVEMAKAVARYITAEVSRRELLGETVAFGEAVSLDGSVPHDTRKEVYRRHQNSEFQFLSVCGLCREGYNDPGISCVAVFRPTKSKLLVEQFKGRGCRPLRGLVDGLKTAEQRKAAIAASSKPDCLIVDLVGISGMADCATTAHILAEGEDPEIADRANDLMLLEEMSLEEAIGMSFDERQEAQQKLRLIHKENEEKASAEAMRRSKVRVKVTYKARTVNDGRDRQVATTTSKPSSAATEKQLAYLYNAGIPYDDRTTKSVASRIIGQHKKGMTLDELRKNNRIPREMPFVPATKPQVGFLKWKNIPFKPGISKATASWLIGKVKTK